MSKDLPPLSEIAIPPQSLDFPSNFYIDTAAVERKLSQININKAPGPDGLPNWFLRDFAPVLPIYSIFNSSIREVFVPLIWKSTNVIPIPKVHPPRNIESNLRPISLIPTIAKLLESISGSWILEAIEPHIDRYQFGSSKGKSITLALADMMHNWSQAMDNKQPVRILLLTLKRHLTESPTI